MFCAVFQGGRLQVGEKLSKIEQTSGNIFLREAALLFDVKDAEMEVSVSRMQARDLGGGERGLLEQIFDRFEKDVLEKKLFGHRRLSKDRGGKTDVDGLGVSQEIVARRVNQGRECARVFIAQT